MASDRKRLIFAGQGIPKGGSTQAFSYLLDIFPTVCSLTGIQAPVGVEGRNLQPVWQGKASKVRDSVFLSFSKIQRSVRDDRWKLIRYPKINYTQLFDLKNDPHELHNLADDPAQAGRVQEMWRLLEKSQREVGDALPLTVAEPGPKEIDMAGRQREPDRWQPEWIRRKYFGTDK